MMNKRISLIFLALILIGAATFFSLLYLSFRAPEKSDKIKVTASFYPLYFFSSTIGGNKADVINMIPAGAEPHDYEPRAMDMARLEKSRLVVLNGGGLEPWADDVKKNINPQETFLIEAGEGLMDRKIEQEGESRFDPHVWLSPALAVKIADKIAQGFTQADPANKNYYEANKLSLKVRLEKLDKAYREGLQSCAGKNIITSHAAFGYLAARYGLKQTAIAGLSPEAEPSPRQLADIVDFAKENNVKYIFFENMVSARLAETIARETGAQTLVLDPIEGLSEEDISSGKDYFTQMENNLANLKVALQCHD